MRSAVHDVLPVTVRRSLTKLGADLSAARRRRALTAEMMAERLAVSRSTWHRVEKGDPGVGVGIYAMALFVLGLPSLADLAEVANDPTGLALDAERLPTRVRRPRR